MHGRKYSEPPPASRKSAPPDTAMRPLVAGLLSPTFVHFMPTTLTMMPINPSSTDTTMRARHVWMWTGNRRGGGCRRVREGTLQAPVATSQQLLHHSCDVFLSRGLEQIQDKVLQQILNIDVCVHSHDRGATRSFGVTVGTH